MSLTVRISFEKVTDVVQEVTDSLSLLSSTVGLIVGSEVGFGVRVGAKVGLLVAWHCPELVVVGPQPTRS